MTDSTRMQRETAESLKTFMMRSSSIQLHEGTRYIENDKGKLIKMKARDTAHTLKHIKSPKALK